MNICGIVFTIIYQYYFIICFLFVYNLTYPYMKILLVSYFFYDMFFSHKDVSWGLESNKEFRGQSLGIRYK